ncbi:SulP family inorganic anion transporter [Pseudomonas syringae]|nr:SulP family inorganic anion transporter [Pseudomonas syringae]MBD8575290.1 SulP family inorganic anion transporter [Pseudomonas syringae]MBD8788183.1 SulP family inorganic anion transporter [Pseudomonas syringae]MBD8799618.1 SulP family inorganic anion transporter [Pseudomonas syringae]MBD8812698.1 SulP family inorganic anion transporter [Pseudomonas syringae]
MDASATKGSASIKSVLPRELLASVVVFLVALPLCMGIAIASGMPPAKGLITGIIGGLVVGFIAGSPLQVSGPAAGLAVLVFELVREHGMAMLGPILLLAGLLQVLAGRFKLGCWFRVTAPAVVYGMLAGIGVLIVLSQLHVMFDSGPKPSGLDNLIGFPATLVQAIGPGTGMQAGLLGLGTIAIMWTWEKLRPHSLRFVPGALLGVGIATAVSLFMALQVKRVQVPADLSEAIDWLRPADLLNLADPAILVAAFAVAFIASAETLLSAAAVDRMHNGVRSDFDKELSAQGVGNMLCGLLGALPMTGVIVRSSANVQAGATTRMSTIFHGLWLLAFVLLLSSVLQSIPVASLAGVLVYTGLKLVDLKAFRGLGRYGRMPMFTYAATAAAIIFTDLLTGVLIGFALTLVKLAFKAARLKISLVQMPDSEELELRLVGAATFLKVPALTQVLGTVPTGSTVHVPLSNLTYIDHACLELLEQWGRANAAHGTRLLIEPRGLKRRLEGRVRTTTGIGASAS